MGAVNHDQPSGADAPRQSRIARQETRDRYADFYDLAPVGFVTLTDKKEIAEVNLTGAAMLGVARAELLRQDFESFVAPEDTDHWGRQSGNALTQDTRLNFEIALRRRDGGRIDVRLDCQRMVEDGRPPLLHVVLTDITARKQAEVALREQEEFFRLIAENIGDFVAVLDVDGRRIYNSPSYRRHFGDERDLRGTNSFEEIHEADRPRIEKAFRDTVASGIGQRCDYRFVLADGGIRHMESRGAVIRDGAGRVARIVVVSRDVTERKLAENQLRIAAAAFEAHEGMLVTDALGLIQRVNGAFSEMTGYTADEVIGRTPRLLRSGRHDAAFYAAMWESIGQTGLWQGEIWNRRKSGDVYPQWLTITAIRDADGQVTHYVATMTDISARKAAEDEVRHLAFNDDLTQLPNRRLLMDRMQRATAASGRSRRRGAVMLIDLDNFKAINDVLGHDQGDLLLQQAAQRLSRCVREGDTVARLGGDEFVVMLEDLSEELEQATRQAEAAGEKILATLNQPYELRGGQHRCTPSIGVTLFADQRQSIDELLRQADLAMYQSKSAGRNSMHFFSGAP
jgi:diguanylate cyclase (GGDEF)-like protein/PAS domain S-box-containing protein